MSNCSFVDYTCWSPNYSSRHGNSIQKITIHHMAGNLSIETCGNVFAPTSRRASAHYGVGSDGRIGQYVDERYQAWTSGSSWNDRQAVTIEVADDEIGGNWHVSDTALEATIKLCVDICKRNDIKRLNFTGDSSGNLTMHRYFQRTNCPGHYLESQFPYIAKEVNNRLSQGELGWINNGWGWWYRYQDGSYPHNEWKEFDAWYWFNENGYAAQDAWRYIKGYWYYFGHDCRMVTGWKKLDAWYYLGSDGSAATGWRKIDGYWYYFGSDCRMATGWKFIDGYWYYLGNSGAMATGWQYVDGYWYLLGENGTMETGLINYYDGYIYYLNSSTDKSDIPVGAMRIGWVYRNKKWRYFNKSKDCQPIGSQFFNHWVEGENNTWYYIKNDGTMAADETIKIGDTTYKFDKEGKRFF